MVGGNGVHDAAMASEAPRVHEASVGRLPPGADLGDGPTGAPNTEGRWLTPSGPVGAKGPMETAPTQALFIRSEWCEEIFRHGKIWEIRGTRTAKRGPLCIAASKTNTLVGAVTLVDCLPVGKRGAGGAWEPASGSRDDGENFIWRPENHSKHRIQDEGVVQNYTRLWAWVFEDVTAFEPPVPWKPPHGPVQFVPLARSVRASVSQRLCATGPQSPELPVAGAFLWDPRAVDFLPELLAPGTHYPPCLRADLDVAGPLSWDDGVLTVPPDGYCLIYAYLAACDPQKWAALPRSHLGFIQDRAAERAALAQAKEILARIVQRMREDGAGQQAARLEAGGYPGDEEMRYYSAEFGCAILVVPTDADAFPLVCGNGSIGMEVQHTFDRGAGGAAGHFVLARSWLQPPFTALAAPPADQAPVRRRLRGKQNALASYGPPPSKTDLLPKEPPAQRPAVQSARKAAERPAAAKKGPARFCVGAGGAPCCFSTTVIGQPARRGKGKDHCIFCSVALLRAALSTPRGRGNISQSLKKYFAAQPEGLGVLEKALAKVEACSPGSAEGFQMKARAPKRMKAAAGGDARGRASEDKAAQRQMAWTACKQRRQPVQPDRSDQERSSYRAAVLADRRKGKAKFFPEAPRRARATGDDLMALVDKLAPGHFVRRGRRFAALVFRRVVGHVPEMLHAPAAAPVGESPPTRGAPGSGSQRL